MGSLRFNEKYIMQSTLITTKYWEYKVGYYEVDWIEYVLWVYWDMSKPPVIRFHSACLFAEAFHSQHCDCFKQLECAMQSIQENNSGIIIYSYQEGRGIWLKNKIRTMETQRIKGVDTVTAFEMCWFPSHDLRKYTVEADLVVNNIQTNEVMVFMWNQEKIHSLEKKGLTILKVLSISEEWLWDEAMKERSTKKDKLWYLY